MSSTPSPLLLLLLLLTWTFIVDVVIAESACKSSLYPKLCNSLISPVKLASTDPYEYGLHSVKKALNQAKRTAGLIDSYILKGSGCGAQLAVSRGALHDCRQLAGLNEDFLVAVQAELGPGGSALDRTRADRVSALMSALLTNQQTCYDGLKASGTYPELYDSFSKDARLYGVSLELVTSVLDRNGGRRVRSDEPGSGSHISVTGRWLLDVDGDVSIVPLSQSVTVAQDGTGNFTTVSDAVAFAPNSTSLSEEDKYFGIYIKEGVYRENVVVPKNKQNLIVIGAGIDRTVITGSRSVRDGSTTFNSATFVVQADRFIAINITFENTAGPENHQAVAVRNSADLSLFYRCKFLGYQDTLYTHSLRQFYRDCHIYGTIDFIFGNAASVFQNSLIFARKPLPHQSNAITAQGRTHPDQNTGISIHNCTILPSPELESDLNSTTKTYLGRPWKEYSRTVYMQSYLGGLIEPQGWLEWNETFALDTLFYGEYENSGPGSDTSQRVTWSGHKVMNWTEASNFTLSKFVTGDAWLPAGVPYSSGLL